MVALPRPSFLGRFASETAAARCLGLGVRAQNSPGLPSTYSPSDPQSLVAVRVGFPTRLDSTRPYGVAFFRLARVPQDLSRSRTLLKKASAAAGGFAHRYVKLLPPLLQSDNGERWAAERAAARRSRARPEGPRLKLSRTCRNSREQTGRSPTGHAAHPRAALDFRCELTCS